MRQRKSWTEILADNKQLPRVRRITLSQQAPWGGTAAVTPHLSAAGVAGKRFPLSRSTTNETRAAFAATHGATISSQFTSATVNYNH
jgi:hypothetical protein